MLLKNIPYFHCLLEVERYWAQSISTRDACIKSLTAEEMDLVAELARWVWEKRFFTIGWGPFIGGKILEEIVKCATPAKINFPVAMFSAHDYTILSLLSA